MTPILDFGNIFWRHIHGPACARRVKIQNLGHFYKNLQNYSFMQYILNAEIRFVFAILFILVQGADGVELRHPRGEHYINLG